MAPAHIPRAIREFLAQPNIAVVSTVMPSGSPHTAATWYDFDDGRVLLNMDESRRRLEYMRLNPRVALTAMQEGNWSKQVSVMGRVVSIEPDSDLRDIDRLRCATPASGSAAARSGAGARGWTSSAGTAGTARPRGRRGGDGGSGIDQPGRAA
jgi:Pyridoxamine 5'-phosphate oxidase